MKGRIVCSKAGRDKGKFMAVLETDGSFVYVCDGKERPIERPKRKNIKHIALTNSSLDITQFNSNRSLRKALKNYGASAGFKEE